MWAKKSDAVDVLRHENHDVARTRRSDFRGGLRFELVVEEAAHRQAVEGHEGPANWVRGSGHRPLEEAEDHGAHTMGITTRESRRPVSTAPAPQGEQADADHEEDDARHNGGQSAAGRGE